MKTFFMVKPDGVKRNLIGEVISRVEKEGFQITKIKMMDISEELAKEHYGEHADKPFFNDLVSFITSGPEFLLKYCSINQIEVQIVKPVSDDVHHISSTRIRELINDGFIRR